MPLDRRHGLIPSNPSIATHPSRPFSPPLVAIALALASIWGVFGLDLARNANADEPVERHLLYVATPGIRNYLEYGGHGLLVFDRDKNHRFVKRIPIGGLDEQGKPLNIKGICAHAETRRIYITTIKTLMALDAVTEKLLWERSYDGGCDRPALSPDGKVIYLPSLEGPHWHVVNAATGDVLSKLVLNSGAHNTIYALDGAYAYLAGLKSPYLAVTDTKTHTQVSKVGPFGAAIRPFTVNGSHTLCFVNVNALLGFEVGDLKTGKFLHRVEVPGVTTGPVKRHGCPSHGIGLTPDERELWVVDAHNHKVHVFDATVMPPRFQLSITVRDEPGWVTFSLDGRQAYPSTGDVIDVATHSVITSLTDETGAAVQSEKMLEFQTRDGLPYRTGDQFGLGRVLTRP